MFVYLSVKSFLSSFDSTKEIDPKLYDELQEALAIGDFLFDDELKSWLSDVDSDAHCLLNTIEIIKSFPHAMTNTQKDLLNKERLQLERYEDNLQNYHCELYNRFEGKIEV